MFQQQQKILTTTKKTINLNIKTTPKADFADSMGILKNNRFKRANFKKVNF